MNNNPEHAATPCKPYASELLPSAQPANATRWFIRILVWLAVAAVYVLTLKYDVALMHWRYELLPEGPRGMFKQLLCGFREFGQLLVIVITMVIVFRMDRRRWTIIPVIIVAQMLSGIAYNAGKLTIARYRPQQAIKQVLATLPEPTPDMQKDTYALSNIQVRQTWIGWRPVNGKSENQSFPSGHSAAAFAFAGVLTWFYPKLIITFWLLACGCAASRYFDAVHWLSDCVAGASIGYLAAWLSLRPAAWLAPFRMLRRKSPNRIAVHE